VKTDEVCDRPLDSFGFATHVSWALKQLFLLVD